MLWHSGGRTDDSNFTSWTEVESVAWGYARSHANGGVVLEIDFASRVARDNDYRHIGERLGEAEYLIEGIIRSGVRVRRATQLK